MAKRVPKKRKYTAEFVNGLTDRLRLWCKNEKSLWLGEFAAENGMHRDRLLEIAEHNQEFADVFLLAKQVQENKLFRLGLSKKFNASMPIFALKNVAGWRDTQDITSNGKELFSGIEVTIHERKD